MFFTSVYSRENMNHVFLLFLIMSHFTLHHHVSKVNLIFFSFIVGDIQC